MGEKLRIWYWRHVRHRVVLRCDRCGGVGPQPPRETWCRCPIDHSIQNVNGRDVRFTRHEGKYTLVR
jgi:hypothetical protein